MPEELKQKMRAKMTASLQHLKHELGTIRTGRASASLFDSVKVNFYGTPTPLSQMATVSIPDSRTILIQPWDISQISEVEKAINLANLGLSPSNDGKQVRIGVPPLTEDRRKEFVKRAKKMGEEGRISIRNLRRESNEQLKKLQKDGEISEDILHDEQNNVQGITNEMIKKIDDILHKKEADVLEI